MRRTFGVLIAAGMCFLGSGSANAQSINLATGGADPIWRGTQAGAKAGASLDQGAVNSSDSRRDLIIGSPGTDGPGAVYVVNGGPIRTGDLSMNLADTAIHGATSGDLFGAATASANITSLENTSPRQLVVAAPGALNGRGIVYVFAGGFHPGDSLTTANAVAQIQGLPGDQLGTALATGDLNNDGYREIIIGAPGTHRVYVIFGGTYLSGTYDLAQSPQILAMFFDAPGLGKSIAAGDINADGIYDLLLGRPSANTVYATLGRNGTMPPSGVDLAFSGIDAGDDVGTAIRLADLNGDDVTDLIISAPNGDGPDNTRTDAGEVYVLWGGAAISSRSLANADVTFYGTAASGRFGTLLGAGDINRDKPNDLVFGSPGTQSGAGTLDIYYGRTRSTIGIARADGTRVVDFKTEAPSRSIVGDTAGGTITAVQVFEVTGEGARDVIVGMSGNNNGVGAVYFTISPRLTLSSANVTLATDPGITTGAAVSVRNVSTIPITWRTSSNRSWLTATVSGSTSAAAAGDVVMSANSSGLAPGTYTATITVTSTSVHLQMSQPITVTFTVREPGFPNPTIPATTGQPSGARYNILFRHGKQGYLALWQMNGVTLTGIQQLSINQMADPSWRIAGYGDLDGDGERDIVWQDDTNGFLGLWLMKGSQVMNTLWLSINQIDPKWKVRAVGDFNGDGKADLILRHSDGWLGVWFMNGANVVKTDFLSIDRLSDPNWVIAGAGDTDGDGKADIIWQHKTEGWLGVWSVDGARVISTRSLSIDKLADPQWTIVGVGDINGDRRADLLWQHTNGTLATWWLNGSQVTGTYYLNPSNLSDPAWTVAGPK